VIVFFVILRLSGKKVIMLTEKETLEINTELTHCVTKASASVEALNIVQRHRGWVSDEAVKGVAALLDMTPDELDAVATFYSFIFRSRGTACYPICDSISCWVMDTIPSLTSETRLGITFGETTKDKRFTCSPYRAWVPVIAHRLDG
jgi:NADH-quinone oxidoreductase subunit E